MKCNIGNKNDILSNYGIKYQAIFQEENSDQHYYPLRMVLYRT